MLFKLLSLGLYDSLELEEAVRIKFLNAAALLFATVLSAFVFFHVFITNMYDVAAVQFIISLGVPVTLWLQFKHKYIAARVVLFVFIHIVVFITSMILLIGHGNEYYYIATSILILTQSKKVYWAAIFIGLNLILFVLPHIYYPYINEHYKMVTALSVFVSTLLAVRFFMIIQKQYRERLNAQKDKLAELNMEKNDLMSIVAHDLKSPLAQIKGLVSILELEGSQLSKEQIELIEKIKGVTANQHKQITAFLDVKALEEKIEKINYADFDIVKNIKLVVEDMSTLARSKNIQLVDEYNIEKLFVYGSEDYLDKIISNLISNAIKFSYPNSVVKLEVIVEKNQILIAVKDKGQGFKETDLPKIFLMNEVLSATPTADESATGIGLYIVKKYVDMMNGSVWLESEEGKGSTFFVKLPR